jgi:hypothetical protein
MGAVVSVCEQEHLHNCIRFSCSSATVNKMFHAQDTVWGCVAVGMWRACGNQVETGSEIVTSAGANAL